MREPLFHASIVGVLGYLMPRPRQISLEIFPEGMHMLDLILVTFVYIQKSALRLQLISRESVGPLNTYGLVHIRMYTCEKTANKPLVHTIYIKLEYGSDLISCTCALNGCISTSQGVLT